MIPNKVEQKCEFLSKSRTSTPSTTETLQIRTCPKVLLAFRVVKTVSGLDLGRTQRGFSSLGPFRGSERPRRRTTISIKSCPSCPVCGRSMSLSFKVSSMTVGTVPFDRNFHLVSLLVSLLNDFRIIFWVWLRFTLLSTVQQIGRRKCFSGESRS